VFDTAEAITQACEVPLEQIKGETINVATGVDESVEQIADMILELLGKPASLKSNIDDRPGQVDRHIGSTDRAEQLLGWTSKIAFADGLERTIAWYRNHPEWWQKVLAAEQTAQTV
jgi:dTDP-glucose 4,6-dehydratase